MRYRITVLPQQQNIDDAAGENLLQLLRRAGVYVHAPCGGNGSCGKCRVLIDGHQALACHTVVDRDMTVTLPERESMVILTDSAAAAPGREGYYLAFDIGTTTVVGYLLNGATGEQLACQSALNPQTAYGADVISRIQAALRGELPALSAAIRDCVGELAGSLCRQAGIPPRQIRLVSLVGNPAMQQLYLGILPENLARVPFAPVLKQVETVDAKAYLPLCENARLLIVPDISGFVGADTLACILSTGLHREEALTLLVDIGTNGELVLGNQHRMVACSAAAGPALEGANIQWGMRGEAGAIDHVRRENGEFVCSVIGGGEAKGICGSGILDAVAAALDAGLINARGKIENKTIALTDPVCLTQEDIRQVQLAKGAIAAGIALMADHLGVALQDIQKVYLAGAFGTYMDPASACRIGLLPAALEDRILAVGNAAGGGAKLLACREQAQELARTLVEKVQFLELASAPDFQRCFARHMRFSPSVSYWQEKALAAGFSYAAELDVDKLQPLQAVRDMCAEDKCGAYGKNWTCPPHCGTLSQCDEALHRYTRGIVLQTVGSTEKLIDTKAYRRIEAQHLQQFHTLCRQLRRRHPDALCLGSGGCRICEQCAFPDSCRFPEQACSSMEGYGLLVSRVCQDSGLAYHHGQRTVTYTACILF